MLHLQSSVSKMCNILYVSLLLIWDHITVGVFLSERGARCTMKSSLCGGSWYYCCYVRFIFTYHYLIQPHSVLSKSTRKGASGVLGLADVLIETHNG